jgi:uncharacterized membrane protein YeaQ/YmgE (transglycosylase-associated protein family)
MGWLAAIVAGAILGFLGRWIAPGDKDNIPAWLTIIVGIVSAILGFWVSGLLNVDSNLWRWIISLIVAIVLVMLTSMLLARRGRSTTTV